MPTTYVLIEKYGKTSQNYHQIPILFVFLFTDIPQGDFSGTVMYISIIHELEVKTYVQKNKHLKTILNKSHHLMYS